MPQTASQVIANSGFPGPGIVAIVDQNNNIITDFSGGGGPATDTVVSGNLTSASGAGSTVVMQLGEGQATWEAQLTGTFSAGTTIAFQGSDDAPDPTNWEPAVGYDSSLTKPTPITQISGPGPFIIRGPAAGYEFIQLVCTALQDGDNVAVRLIGSTGAMAGGGPVNIPNGADITEGSTTDAAVLGDNNGTISAKLRGLTKILNDVWDSVNHFLLVKATQSGTWLVNTPSSDATVFASGAQTTTQTQADQTNNTAKGIKVVLDMTVVTASPSVTLEIDGKDPASGKYYSILTGAAVTTISTNVYTVYPGATASANAVANDILPHTWRIKVTANNANSGSYSVGASLLP